jgi:hypothetical protein
MSSARLSAIRQNLIRPRTRFNKEQGFRRLCGNRAFGRWDALIHGAEKSAFHEGGFLMATMPKPVAVPKPVKPLPAPNSDFYELVETLPADEVAVVRQVRAFMETKVAPIVTKYWVEDAFPFELVPSLRELNIGGVGMQGYGCRGGSSLLAGLIAMEMARVDVSVATFFGVHSGLAMSSIYFGGSEEQKQKWLPPMARFE